MARDRCNDQQATRQVFFARTLLGQKPAKLHESSKREPLAVLPRTVIGVPKLCRFRETVEPFVHTPLELWKRFLDTLRCPLPLLGGLERAALEPYPSTTLQD